MKEYLPKIREQIDSVDDKLMALLRERATLAKQAGDIKKESGAQGFARLHRQADILRRLAPEGDLLSEESVRAIYREIISGCLAVEKPPTVAYLGPAHTFTHDAARKFFGDSANYQACHSIREAIYLTDEDKSDFTVIPFENSSNGTVGETFEALLDTYLSIDGETMLRVRHNLLAKSNIPLQKIERIYAHSQALAQCNFWLNQHTPHTQIEPTFSNAAAAKYVAEGDNKNLAAIASQYAGEHYGLTTLAEGIEDSDSNTTRFFVLGKSSPEPSKADKTSFIMTTPSKPGALYHLLEPLNRLDINMTKFESRSAHGGSWEYFFFVDIDGHQKTPKVAKALKEMGERTKHLKVLGSYPKAVK